jgi:hypothetical protein
MAKHYAHPYNKPHNPFPNPMIVHEEQSWWELKQALEFAADVAMDLICVLAADFIDMLDNSIITHSFWEEVA